MEWPLAFFSGYLKVLLRGGWLLLPLVSGVYYTLHDGIDYFGVERCGLAQLWALWTHYWAVMAIPGFCSLGNPNHSGFSALAANIRATPNPSRAAVTE